MGKKVIKKQYVRLLSNGDLIVAEVVDVGDQRYKDGIMYTFRCIGLDGNTRFAIENGHDRAHIHRGGRKEFVDYDWKTAYAEFDRMVAEHEKQIGPGE